MAKARKQKSGGEEQKAAEDGKKPATAVVRHQKLCLSIDMKRRMVFGHTELEVVIPERGLVELYADEMTIRSISVDGEPADYKFFPHHQVADVEKRWHSASCPDLAADAACTEYISYLEKEMAPNLIIPCQQSETWINDEQSQIHATNGSLESHGESKHTSNNCNGHIVHENVKLISIDYWIEKPKTGIHFWGNVLYTDNQIRRAHCWFPCMDSSLQRCCYDLEFTVDSNFVAVSNGILLHQTINARIKLAYALARQWFGIYITAESSNDEWLLDGLAGFLTDSFIKKFLGNNEARFRRYKANCAVCKIDVSGATALSSSAVMKDNYGTQGIGLYGKIRTWKSFRHLANKIGNLERPFLKEFFPRWLESCGCPVLRMGFCYNKRKNMIELAVLRGCTAVADAIPDRNPETEAREANPGWPGMMSIRVHELDGMYDHPILSMDGETWQLLEIQCHSKLSVKRIQKTKKGAKTDGSDDNCDVVPATDLRSGVDSPLLWVRVDPEMEYLAEIDFHQPVQMWINQLEKDKDVVAQMQAISSLEALPHSFSIVNTLSNFLNDSKAFWRVRIEAAFALARLASEETDLAGLQYLVKFYKSRRYDADIGLPRPNDFHDYQEYFVLEAIPHAVASVRAADGKSPREAVEFVLLLLKYNDNNGNPYSDVYWLAALVQSIGELEFGQQIGWRIVSAIPKKRLMPSCNGILTVSCIRTLTQISLKLSASLSVDRVYELIKPFRNPENMIWAVRIEASRALLDLEFFSKGLDAALVLFVEFLEEEPSLRGQVKLAVHAMHLCQVRRECESGTVIGSHMLVTLLHLLASRMAFNNVLLRHYLFCILQIAAQRADDMENVIDHSHGGHNETEVGPSSSVSVDAPLKVLGSPKMSTSNQNIEDVSSFQRQQSLMTASIGSVKVANINEIAKELQCTADSKKGAPPEYQSSPSIHLDVGDADLPKNIDIKPPQAVDDQELTERSKKRKKDKDKKRKREEKSDHKGHRDDPEYLEKKRLKKERKRAEKEMAKLQSGANKASSSVGKASEQRAEVRKVEEAIESKMAKNEEAKVDSIRTTLAPKIRIKIKGQSLQGPNK
ncbi:hypothetical protein QJS10_CPA06g02183 [Acorus calamus]|uniref:Transcription initiation factor TFIID subunit 2 n=1 Tax=Acorus calamus TaxID=4465 RepID=A0AAV9EMF0_ACOCL|nr:hypothetical protein QJS10_CPA06g02183 [Acorus calamus]